MTKVEIQDAIITVYERKHVLAQLDKTLNEQAEAIMAAAEAEIAALRQTQAAARSAALAALHQAERRLNDGI